MRLWHYRLLPYLPDAQFKGQLRELVAIMHDWRDKGTTTHLLINKITEYPKSHLVQYFVMYETEYHERYGKWLMDHWSEFKAFNETKNSVAFLDGWHNKEYLRVCMANLYEKHFFGVGNSRISDQEWKKLLDGYKAITSENYLI